MPRPKYIRIVGAVDLMQVNKVSILDFSTDCPVSLPSVVASKLGITDFQVLSYGGQPGTAKVTVLADPTDGHVLFEYYIRGYHNGEAEGFIEPT